MFIFHFTQLISPHYLVKHKSTKFEHNASRRFETWQHWNPFIEQGVKWRIGYNLLAQKLLPYIFWISQGGFCLSTARRTEYATPSLSWSERYSTSFLQHCGRRIHQILTQSTIYRPSICSVLQEKIYPFRIADVDELKKASDRRVGTLWPVDCEWFYRLVVTLSSQRSCLCERGILWAPIPTSI